MASCGVAGLDKKRNAGHKTDAMLHVYDHEVPEVDAAQDRKIQR